MPWTKPYHPPENSRLEPELYQQTGRITFITVRAYKNSSPFLNSELNNVIIDTLRTEQDRLHCSVYSYCLMPDHLHFLIEPRQDGYSVLTFTDQFKGKTTNLSWNLGWKGKLWQPRSYDHQIRAEENLIAIAEYIINNPIRRELVQFSEDWSWGGYITDLPCSGIAQPLVNE